MPITIVLCDLHHQETVLVGVQSNLDQDNNQPLGTQATNEIKQVKDIQINILCVANFFLAVLNLGSPVPS